MRLSFYTSTDLPALGASDFFRSLEAVHGLSHFEGER